MPADLPLLPRHSVLAGLLALGCRVEPPAPPTDALLVHIDQPADGQAAHQPCQDVVVGGVIADPSALHSDARRAYEWSLDDLPVGMGVTDPVEGQPSIKLSAAQLRPGGSHMLRLTTWGSSGQAVSATSSLRILANAPPKLELLRPFPGQRFPADSSVAVLAVALDANPDVAGRLVLDWSVDGDAPSGSRYPQSESTLSWSVPLTQLDLGEHNLLVAATDGCGDTVLVDVPFTIGADCSPSIWYVDDDGDGYGNPARPSSRCDAEAGTVANDSDCDDSDAQRHPGANELCNGLDDDCDTLVDDLDPDLSDGTTVYRDRDGDGWGDALVSAERCDAGSWVLNDQDCDDRNSDVGGCQGSDDDTRCGAMMGDDDGRVPTWAGECVGALGYTHYAGHCYYAVTEGQTSWEDARATCRAAGGVLAVPGSQGESEHLYRTAGPTFVGGCTTRAAYDWQWVSGEKWDYTSFAPGEPNGTYIRKDCMVVLSLAGSWTATWCDSNTEEYSYICEFSPLD